MFVTKQAFSQWIPDESAHAGNQYWRAMLFSTEAPFFLVRFHAVYEDGNAIQTIAVSWENELIGLVENLKDQLVSVCRFFLNDDGDWESGQVVELWHPALEDGSTTGPLLFVMRDLKGVFDTFSKKVQDHSSGRRLIVRIESKPSKGAQH